MALRAILNAARALVSRLTCWSFFNLGSILFNNQPQDNVQAVEDSAEGDGSGEQTDITAGQSESTDGSEERGVGQAEAADNEGHHGESTTVQASADASQPVSGCSPLQLCSFLLVPFLY